MGKKRGPTRLDMRRQAEAAEARDTEKEDDAEEVEDEDEDAEEADDDSGDSDDDDGEAKPKAKAKAKAKAKTKKVTVAKPKVKRTRAVKEVRLKAVWVVFDNSSKRLDTFPFNQKEAAEEFMAKRAEEKKGTYYIQLVKETLTVT